MLERLESLNQRLLAEHGIRLEMRVGVNTGEIITTASAEPELGTLSGDAVNVAARLEHEAEPGTVLVAERTVRAGTRFQFDPMGTLPIRGRTEPVTVYRLGAPRAESARSIPSVRAPLIGREHELGVLTGLYERVASEARPHMVTIYGAAGVGKSRLTAEFVDALLASSRPPTVLFGRCRPYGEETTYGALADILSERARIRDTDPPELAEQRIERLVERLGGDAAGGGIARLIAYTTGIGRVTEEFAGYTPRQIRSELRSAWRWFFSAWARKGPLVVVIEDIHWADPALLDLLEDLEERAEGPVLFLCPTRLQLTDSRPGWGGGRRSFSSVFLEPLTSTWAERLVDRLLNLNGVSGWLRREILDRAEGNPFFIEEIIRSLIDDGSIEWREGRWLIAGDVEHIEIPDTVQAVLAARIDLLEATEKRALQGAAIVGRIFWTGSIASLVGLSDAETDDILDGLERRDLVTSRLDSRMTGQREYRFTHVLIRDVAYASLSRRDRTPLHRQVADWVGRTAGERQSEVVGLRAHHLTRAYEGGRELDWDPDELEDLRRQAFTSLLEASAAARLRGALGQAKHFAREARRLAAGVAEQAEAAESLGEAFFYGYEGDDAWEQLREAIDLRLEIATPPERDVARLCARAIVLPVRWPGAMQSPPREEIVARYLELGFGNVTDPAGEEAIRLLTMKAFWQHPFARRPDDPRPFLITPEESYEAAQQAVAAAREAGRPDLESGALDGAGSYHISQGDYRNALVYTARRLEIVEDLHDLWEIGDTFAMNGWVNLHLGHFVDAFRNPDTGFERTAKEAPSLALHCLRWRGQARFRLGEWDEVVTDYGLSRELLDEYRDRPSDYVSPLFAVCALIHEIRGEPEEADAVLAHLVGVHESRPPADRDRLPLSRWAEYTAPIAARRGEVDEALAMIEATMWRRPVRLGMLTEARLDVMAEGGRWKEAIVAAGEARHLAEESDLLALAATADLTEGRALVALGNLEPAAELLTGARAAFARLAGPWDEARASLALAEARLAAGAGDEAERVLRPAMATFEALGAARELRRARELADRLAGG
jgi:tetratricopeptide (TPR) repeat protein